MDEICWTLGVFECKIEMPGNIRLGRLRGWIGELNFISMLARNSLRVNVACLLFFRLCKDIPTGSLNFVLEAKR